MTLLQVTEGIGSLNQNSIQCPSQGVQKRIGTGISQYLIPRLRRRGEALLSTYENPHSGIEPAVQKGHTPFTSCLKCTWQPIQGPGNTAECQCPPRSALGFLVHLIIVVFWSWPRTLRHETAVIIPAFLPKEHPKNPMDQHPCPKQ